MKTLAYCDVCGKVARFAVVRLTDWAFDGDCLSCWGPACGCGCHRLTPPPMIRRLMWRFAWWLVDVTA
jgi:hypothetical protein